ncbi:two-component system, NtrC family, nitrogen regulation sensor histidine kinase GlnL [Hydrocarboniphaga daqingensis]|jgi:two-component system nitrogen regulation sensor histidine kinase GlnL|uniref:Sensory histidine kinase/phosphatase NtrB n=1 Tax=Hydrocarboniphaga daqingensis TaxID=490188 RepID=A0A1M5LIL8_9GAMM|nr:nitrogen regulation protein NR(II) [Hydrocarboniphaga daqingensis]SHG64994.1 two-component system, NtrC family, nitrogen regulation sensor histidine kinase GlnL [Hydrocarboniphaga daqingensis]
MKLAPSKSAAPAHILDAQTTAVISLDSALRVVFINSTAESVFGVSRRYAIGELFTHAVPQFIPHAERLREALRAGTGFIERELQLRKSGDQAITVDCTVTPMQLGKHVGLLIEILPMDRHLRISRDELLLAQQQASRELIRSLAHEIKNPLGGIRGAAQLLEREFPDSEHREYTRVIIREVDRLQNLVNRLLGPNRVPQKTAVNVHEVLEHVRQLVEAEAPRGVSFMRDYDPSIPELIGDREQLVQAVLNILRNALQAVGDEGAIALRSRTRRQYTIGGIRHRLVVQIDIEDDGHGIPPAMIDKIFYPMVTMRAEGTGLGLPISQYLIHTHGGVIECKSRPGNTVFSIYLPLDVSAGTPA